MKTKAAIFLIISAMLVSLIFSGCAGSKSEMPGIVFLSRTSYPEAHYDGIEMYSIGFFDREGNYYYSNDSDVCLLSNEEMIRKYEADELTGKIKLASSCDKDELEQNFKKLDKIRKSKNYDLKYPEREPAVIPSYILTWYGLYYDKNRDLQCIPLYMDKADRGTIESNDKRATEIYEWLIGTFRQSE